MATTETQTKIGEITPSEWELMRIVWTKQTIYSRELIELLQQKRDWSESTIKTLLRRLVKKGLLTTEKEDRRFKYTALVSEADAMNETTQQLFDHLCAMKQGVTLYHLIDHLTLSQADIKQLQQLLATKLTTAPAQVACDCLPNECHCD